MPALDVTEAFIGFSEPVRIERRAEVVDGYGQRGNTSTFYDNVPAVITQTPSPVMREPEMQYERGGFTIHTIFRLRSISPGYLPDIVWWHGDAYVVSNLKDWSSWGQGFVRAECDAVQKLDSPPG